MSVPKIKHPQGWPNTEAPGHPVEPWVDGDHWLQEPGQRPRVARWRAAFEMWEPSAPGLSAASPFFLARHGWRYLGIAETPDQVEARIKAAMAEAREGGLSAAA